MKWIKETTVVKRGWLTGSLVVVAACYLVAAIIIIAIEALK